MMTEVWALQMEIMLNIAIYNSYSNTAQHLTDEPKND